MAVWVTSDWHFCHNKPFVYAPRGFDSVEEMNELIVQKFNGVVGAADDVYVLGDCTLGADNEGFKLISQMNGKLHLICGNHDTPNRIEVYKQMDNIVEVVMAERLRLDGYWFWLSHYPTICSNFDTERPLKQRMIALCGHSHTTDPFADMDKGLIYHCEVDAHKLAPVNIEQIISDINNYKKEVKD